jgi:hypothetical protein
MEAKKTKGKCVKNTVFAALLIGASTMVFQGLIQTAMAAEFNKTNTIPTTYVSYAKQSSAAVQISIPKGYKNANYTVKDSELAYYKTQKPTSKDMDMKDAAKIGAQALWNVFKVDLEGQVIEMGYQPATTHLPRSSWHGDVLMNGKLGYDFDIDSVTGELFGITHNRTLDKKVSVAYDKVLAKNPQKYAALARTTAEKLNVVHGKVASVEYNCQGYGNNDPDITFNIKGKNGEAASMTFSRYDKALLGISYNAAYKYTQEYMKQLEQRTEQRKSKGSSNSGSQRSNLQ